MHPFSSVPRVAVHPHRDAPPNKVVDEISLRTPDDLSPLKAFPRHRELRQTVDAINDFLAVVRESAEREKCLLPMPLTNCVRLWPRCGSTSRHCSPRVISESQQELLAGIVRSNSRAARLVNQLLLMMHSEAHISTVMSPVPLTTLIQERMAAPNRWRPDAELSLNSSPTMKSMSQAFGNVWCR